ncbi:hypothetical protein [Synechococcus sp. EJ6-Ellesmere]|uniref:hypothetical protein n=1 Tax=Synechococcus sp. EJ6-Ellesmere TaxID=2823734 RepID=UPI0020CE4853|nr:hypothetical protein [Synechococcus sp. EJ6-Ellesmere]MCP9823900.1 hypothetical protein [Synechococcus sp. EJ6-Ellesmere]
MASCWACHHLLVLLGLLLGDDGAGGQGAAAGPAAVGGHRWRLQPAGDWRSLYRHHPMGPAAPIAPARRCRHPVVGQEDLLAAYLELPIGAPLDALALVWAAIRDARPHAEAATVVLEVAKRHDALDALGPGVRCGGWFPALIREMRQWLAQGGLEAVAGTDGRREGQA